MLNIYEQVDTNKRKSFLIIALFFAFVVIVSFLLAYSFNLSYGFIGLALIFSGTMSYVSYYYSDRLILSISHARPVTRAEFFDFYTVTENLSLSAQIPMPKLFIIDDTAMNAFATGRDPAHAVVCATTGILSRLNRTELEGVIAHELSHIRNYDTRLMSIVSILVGLIALLSDLLLRSTFWGGSRRRDNNSGGIGAILILVGIVLALLSPLIANLIKLAISRRREFLADASGAALTKYPEGLARALEKLMLDQEKLEVANKATAHLYITNPLKNDFMSNLFSTHPPLSERIAALRSQ